MNDTVINTEELNELKTKAKKWDDLEKEIAKSYVREDGSTIEDGDEDNDEMCLITIGEKAASAFGWL
jgi:hypothetical protein